MRTIKFRGKTSKFNNWIFGDFRELTMSDDEKTIAIYPKNNTPNIFDNEVRPETVGQFTGCYDNDGKEIYEGDIIESSDGIRHKLYYDDKDACFKATCLPTLQFMTGCGVSQNWIDEFKKIVVGNIYENPELID